MKKVGFFGGSFDPIHFGHLNLAIQILEKCNLDEILFCPAFQSPFKQNRTPIAPPKDRYEMVEKAIEKIPAFAITPIEIERGGVSYTVETLRSLQKEGIQYHLVLSEETASDIQLWKEPEEILHLAPPIVGVKNDLPPDSPFKQVQIPTFDISSTEIRERFKKKLYCGHLIPAIALDYIVQHRLYSYPN